MRCPINASRPVSRVLYGRDSSPRRDGHSSRTPVAGRLEQPTRAARPTDKALRRENAPRVAPIRFCSRRGLPCRRRYRPRGALLPHPFTLAFSLDGLAASDPAVCFLWRFPWGRPRRTLSGAVSVWSPDFPPPSKRRPSGRLAGEGIWDRSGGGQAKFGRGRSNGRASASRRARNRRRGLFIVASRELWDCATPVGGPVAAPHQVWARELAKKRGFKAFEGWTGREISIA